MIPITAPHSDMASFATAEIERAQECHILTVRIKKITITIM